jgi:type II secretory pathway component PulF
MGFIDPLIQQRKDTRNEIRRKRRKRTLNRTSNKESKQLTHKERQLLILDAAKKIVQALQPLSRRAQERVITYITDVITDPLENGTSRELAIMESVRVALQN